MMVENHEWDNKDEQAVPLANLSENSPEENGAEETIAQTLKMDEARLNDEARVLEQEANELAKDDPAHAAELRMKAESMTVLAKEVGQAAKDVRAHPSDKKTRRKVELLLVRVTTILEAGEQESKVAEEEIHGGGSAEHHHEMVVANHEEDKPQEKKTSLLHHCKTLVIPALHPAMHHHRIPGSEDHSSAHVMLVRVKNTAQHYWGVAQERASQAYDFVAEKASQAGAFAMSVVHKTGHAMSGALHVMAGGLMGATHFFAGVGHTVMGLLPFGGSEAVAEAIHLVAPAAKHPLNAQAIHAVKKLSIPTTIGAPSHYANGEMLAPLPTLFATPAMGMWGVS